MVETAGGSGDDKSNVNTPSSVSTSSLPTENTMLSPGAKQTYFKDNRITIPEVERVGTSNYYDNSIIK